MASGDTLAVFGPAANQPPNANYAALAVRNGHLVLGFIKATQQTATFAGVMPNNYAGGNIMVVLSWIAATAVTGTIGWGVSFERMNAANHDLDADAWFTEVFIAPLTVDATCGKVSTGSVNMNNAGTDSSAAGSPFRVRVRRDVANDTAAGDAQLLSIALLESS
jgi:hypothetical protein